MQPTGDNSGPRSTGGEPQPRKAELIMEEGPDRGLTVPVSADFTVGREVTCDLPLLDDGVSRRQFRIRADETGFVIEDLGSANGTFVNDKRIDARRIYHRDRITCGRIRLCFLCPDCPNPGTTTVEFFGVAAPSGPADRVRLPSAITEYDLRSAQPIPDGAAPEHVLAARTLHALGTIGDQVDVQGVFQTVLATVESVVPCERIVLCRYSEELTSVVPMLHRRAESDPPGGRIPVDHELVTRCCQSQKALSRSQADGGIALAVPMLGVRGVVGAMVVGVRAVSGGLAALPLLCAIARQAGRVLEAFEVSAGMTHQQRMLAHLHREVRDAAEGQAVEQAKLRAVIEAFEEGILLVDGAGRILLQNAAGRRYLSTPWVSAAGDAIESVGGRTLSDWIADLGDDAGSRTRELSVAGDPRVADVVVARVPLAWTSDAAHAGRPEWGVLFILRDITRRKDTEKALRERAAEFLQSQKMEAIGRLAGGVAHDFNNILTVMIGHCELLLADASLARSRRRAIEEILQSGTRAASLTQRLLAFSRRQVLQPRVLDLNSLVREMAPMLRRLIGEHIEFVTELNPDLGRVMADPGQIEQVILNLVVNARDAMPTGGKVTILTDNAQVDEAWLLHGKNRRALLDAAAPEPIKAGPLVMVAVSDTGVGMDAETRQHIFEPFFTTKPPGKGSGLGLSTVFGIVKQSGGDLWVYSEPGQGSTFRVYLPRVDAAIEREAAGPPASPGRGGTETVLVAEDDDAVRETLIEALAVLGYRVLAGRGGLEALEIARAHSGVIDLLLTDVVMPKLRGDELCRLVREVQPGIKVIFMSGHIDSSLVNVAELSRGSGFLQKPFPLERLAAKVREALDQPAAPAAG